MSNSAKSAWPAAGAFPFTPFPIPGFTPAAAGPAAPAPGMDLLRQFWGALPGSTQVPGFLVPTMDVDELDRRIADLRAAESWVEVNLNMLRATIQGLEVQRHTIAALQSLSVAPDAATAAAESPVATPDVAAGQWLGYLQDQFTRVAQAAMAAVPQPAAPAGKTAPRGARKRPPAKAAAKATTPR